MIEPIRIAVETLGCKLNQAESESLSRAFAASGCRVVPPEAAADVYILNTCSVTHIADRKARHLLRLARRRNPAALIVATGCYAGQAAAAISQSGYADIVIGNEQKPRLLQILVESGRLSLPSHQADLSAPRSLRTRSFVRVQDGCSNFCAYCIVPLLRGVEKSRPLVDIITEIGQRVAENCREVVLTGTEVGAYNDSGAGLSHLLQRLLAETGIARLRLSSLQPQEVKAELVALWRDPRLCPHFHLSLQSGSDSVLRRMGRRYSAADYRRAVSLIRAELPDAAVTTDVIVGFPGETIAEFNESLDFCREVGFARIHVFAFSPRPGTRAAAMPNQIAPRVKKARSEAMLALGNESASSFQQSFIGRAMPVLWEARDYGWWSGYTGNYIRVYTRDEGNLANKILAVKLTALKKDGVSGDIDH